MTSPSSYSMHNNNRERGLRVQSAAAVVVIAVVASVVVVVCVLQMLILHFVTTLCVCLYRQASGLSLRL